MSGHQCFQSGRSKIMAPKLSDIAKMTGLSISTVSKAMKNDNEISPETIMVVKKASQKLGYKSPLQKRTEHLKTIATLKKNSTPVICLLFPYAIKNYSYTRLDTLIIDSMENRAQELGVALHITRLTADGKLPEWIVAQKIDAFIMKSYTMPPKTNCPMLYEIPLASIFGFAPFEIPGLRVTSDSSKCVDLVWDIAVGKCGCNEIIVPIFLTNLPAINLETEEKLALLKYRCGKNNVRLTEIDIRNEGEDHVDLLKNAIHKHPGKSAVFFPRFDEVEIETCEGLTASKGIKPGEDSEIISAVYDYSSKFNGRVNWIDLRGREIAGTAMDQVVNSIRNGTPLLSRIQIQPVLARQ